MPIYYLFLTFDHTIAELFSLEGTSGGHWLNSMLKAVLSLKLEQVTSSLVWLSFLLKDLKWSWKLGLKFSQIWNKVSQALESYRVLTGVNEAYSCLVKWQLCFLSIFGVRVLVLRLCKSLHCAQYRDFGRYVAPQHNSLSRYKTEIFLK